MFRLRLAGHVLDVDVAVIARRHPRLAALRERLGKVHGATLEHVDTFLELRLARAIEHFSTNFGKEMGARIDRIFGLRDELTRLYEPIANGDLPGADMVPRLEFLFGKLETELEGLQSPARALEDPNTRVELPRAEHAPPPGDPTPTAGALRALIGPSARVAQRGLLILQEAAPRVVGLLEELAGRDGEAVRRIIVAVGRFLRPDNLAELRGISRFLEVGDDAGALARLLSPSETLEWSRSVPNALRILATFDAGAARGLAAFFRVAGDFTASTALRIFDSLDLETSQIVAIFDTIGRLEGRARNLRRVIRILTRDDHDLTPAQAKGVIGALLSANHLLDLFPDATLVFEDPILRGDVEVRRTDIRVERPGRPPLRVEVKEIGSLRSLGADAARQLKNDIILDASERANAPVPPGAIRPYFETIRWRIRWDELAREIGGDPVPPINDPALRPRVIDGVRGRLRAAFERHEAELRAALSDLEFERYRAAFEADLTFVEFF